MADDPLDHLPPDLCLEVRELAESFATTDVLMAAVLISMGLDIAERRVGDVGDTLSWIMRGGREGWT